MALVPLSFVKPKCRAMSELAGSQPSFQQSMMKARISCWRGVSGIILRYVCTEWRACYDARMDEQELIEAVATADVIEVMYHGSRKWYWRRTVAETMARGLPADIVAVQLDAKSKAELTAMIEVLDRLKVGSSKPWEKQS